MSAKTARRDVLLVAADLNERRLLYGELLEAGYDVLPVPGFALALGELLQKTVEPRLVLIDIQGDAEAIPEGVDHLTTILPGVPIIVVVGALNLSQWRPLRPRLAGLLNRPITIAAIVDVVREFVERRPDSSQCC